MHFHPLPVEVLYLILDQVILDGDFGSLKAISMVSKMFRSPCTKHLFHSIVLTFASDRHYARNTREGPKKFLGFATFLVSNPHILKSIRKVVLRDVSRISSWSSHFTDAVSGPNGFDFNSDDSHLHPSLNVANLHTCTHANPKWDAIAGLLAQILGSLEHLQALEIRSELELDWGAFDVQAKNAIYSLLARPSCAAASVLLASLHNVRDRDLQEFVKHCRDLTLLNVRFSLCELRGRVAPAVYMEDEPKTLGEATVEDEGGPPPLHDTSQPPQLALRKLKLGRQLGVAALDWLAHHPTSLMGVKHLAMESLSAAVPVDDYWTFAQGARASLEHLEWWFEDLAFREQADALSLKQIDLSIFPNLRSFTVRSSQSGQLINLMVILESTDVSNTIETITIVMPTSIDKLIAFRPSAVWKRLDSAFASANFQKHLRNVALLFAWTNQPMLQSSLTALFSAFKKNLPSLRGKNLTVDQRKAYSF